jgi:HEAT repeat protein
MSTLAEMAESDVDADFGAVFRLALGDDDDAVRLAALEGLWEDEDAALVPTLVRLLNADPSTNVRAAAAVSLGRFAMAGELEELNPKMTAVVREALLAAIRSQDQDVDVRRRALESVSCMSGDDISDLIRAAYRDKDEWMAVSAVFAMGRSLDETWAPYVLRELKNARTEIRFEAARAAGELELTDAVPTLLEMLYDPESEVRDVAIEALGNIGGESALQALAELAKSDNESIRHAALEALEIARFNEDPLAPEVLSWLFDREAAERGSEDDEWDDDWDDDGDEDDDLELEDKED